ncbi:unnamed protein product [Lupinus luteus]|uniref:Flavodoxin-like domain-containing protein n=1 Tax=Lupinus luteus TaxID=3873 RepID=A0AAV1Y6W8_LUPLU
MQVFWKFLLQRNLTSSWLKGVHYAVFGLGDSSYPKYNFVAKKLDKRLIDLGGTPIVERGLGDDQHPSGKVQIIYHNIETLESHFSTALDLTHLDIQLESTRLLHPGKSSPDRSRPDCFLKMVKNLPLTRSNHGKDVCHFEFVSDAIEYDVGDVIDILPGQDVAAVDAFIRRCDLILILSSLALGSRVPVKLRNFVELTMDVASASPRRYFFEARFTEHERERLKYFASPEGRDDLYQYNQKERRTVLENNGILSEAKGGGFYAAFSRDKTHKVYVQHKMREQSQRIWNLLAEGAAVYIAGSSTKMPTDVTSAFEEIVSKENEVSSDVAVRWIRALERSGKYHIEAWS